MLLTSPLTFYNVAFSKCTALSWVTCHLHCFYTASTIYVAPSLLKKLSSNLTRLLQSSCGGIQMSDYFNPSSYSTERHSVSTLLSLQTSPWMYEAILVPKRTILKIFLGLKPAPHIRRQRLATTEIEQELRGNTECLVCWNHTKLTNQRTRINR